MLAPPARWPLSPGGPLPSTFDPGATSSSLPEVEDEPVFGRATMKRNSMAMVDQFRGSPGAAPAGSSWRTGGPGPTLDKENSYRAPGKHIPLQPTAGRINLATEGLRAPVSGAFPSAAARAPDAVTPRLTGKWQISDQQMHQPWGAPLPPTTPGPTLGLNARLALPARAHA